MTKRLGVLLGLLAAVASVVVLTATAQAGTHTQKATNVTLAGWSSGTDEDALLQQVLDVFNKTHPSVHASFDVINTNYTEAMTARFAAHNPPDVFYVDSSVVGAWEHQHVLQPLNSFVTKSHFNTKKFFPKLLGAFEHGKTIYGFPKDWSPLATEINNYIFAKAGITKAPRTWTQLKSDAQTIVSKHLATHPICLSPDWARMGAFLYQNGGSLTKNITSSANAKAVDFYVGLIKSGLAYTAPSNSWCGAELGQGHAAIIFEGNWVIPFMKSSYPKTHYSIAPMVRGKSQGNLAFTVSYSMAKDARNKQAAWTLLSWLVSKKGQTIWMSKGLALPSRTDVPAVGGRKPFLAAAPYAHGWGFGNPYFANAYTTMNNDLSAVISGNKSTAAMLSDAAKALKGK